MSGSGFDYMQLLPLMLIFVVFYFLLIRPQQKKLKAHQEMLAALRRGDKVVTNGGLIGNVIKINSDREVLVEIADGVRVRIVRSMIAEVLAKTEAVMTEMQGDIMDEIASDVVPLKKSVIKTRKPRVTKE